MSPFDCGIRPSLPAQTLSSLGGDEGDRTPEPPACKAGALPAELHPHIGQVIQSDSALRV